MDHCRYDDEEHQSQRPQRPKFHFAVAGEGDDAIIVAYGSAVAVGVLSRDDDGPQKAWTCTVCTFYNSETLGRFCSMCGSPRTVGNSAPDQPICHEQQGQHHWKMFQESPVNPSRNTDNSRRVLEEDNSGLDSPCPLEGRDTVTELLPSSSHHRRHHYPSFRGPRRLSSLESPRSGGLQRLQSLEPPETWDRNHSPVESPTGPSFGHDQENSLNFEDSFSLLSLMDGPPLVDPSSSSSTATTTTMNKAPSTTNPAERQRPSALSEKEFQMSFANWSISDNGAWTCTACTFVNTNPLHLSCEVCGENRPSSKDKMMEQSQRVMQDMFDSSFRTGQHDFLQRQSQKIEELEDRVVASERLQDIMNYQNEILDEYSAHRGPQEHNIEEGDECSEENDVKMSVAEKARLTNEWINHLEQVHDQERSEQDHIEARLRSRREELGLDRYASSGGPGHVGHVVPLEQYRNPAVCTVRAQERLLSQWKNDWDSRGTKVQEIRERQRALFERLQQDSFSMPP